ncbi:MAG: ATP-dependent DNA helicase, partial [Deltaproteobacteria bacterium]|nr:ATP-dependent DNA helicase [Deltaproteobacteria bacterium]
LRRFYRISEIADKEHTILKKRKGKNGYRLTILNLDPSKLLSDCFKNFRSSILFSATLIPFDYFKKILFNQKTVSCISFPSPFPEENCSVVIRTDIDTRYNKRDDSINPLCEAIFEAVEAKNGNYIVFFPSYSYMNQTKECFIELYPEQSIHLQESGMDESERAHFLDRFSREEDNETLLAFAVMGGIFGEGIDLKGDRLI